MPRKPHTFNFIYKTTCLVTGRYYIGMHSTSNLDDNYLGSGTRLWKSIKKYGKDNHSREILEFLPDRKSLAEREREIVDESVINDPLSMNLMKGGEAGGFMNEEHQLKCSAAGGRTTNPEKSKGASERMTNLNLNRIQEGSHKNWSDTYSWQGRTHKAETKSKIGAANSLKQTGSSNSQFGTKWMSHPEQGPTKVKSELVPEYLSRGYSLGRRLSNK
jgi:hypothetical protein